MQKKTDDVKWRSQCTQSILATSLLVEARNPYHSSLIIPRYLTLIRNVPSPCKKNYPVVFRRKPMEVIISHTGNTEAYCYQTEEKWTRSAIDCSEVKRKKKER